MDWLNNAANAYPQLTGSSQQLSCGRKTEREINVNPIIIIKRQVLKVFPNQILALGFALICPDQNLQNVPSVTFPKRHAHSLASHTRPLIPEQTDAHIQTQICLLFPYSVTQSERAKHHCIAYTSVNVPASAVALHIATRIMPPLNLYGGVWTVVLPSSSYK